jgi:hypothetical protein
MSGPIMGVTHLARMLGVKPALPHIWAYFLLLLGSDNLFEHNTPFEIFSEPHADFSIIF